MRSVSIAFVFILFFVLSPAAFGGRVRTLATTSKDMPVIYLMTGRSTVLRFPSTPKKVVIGNQNYFNIEFIDSDLTIQPLGSSSSNLFVYGDGFTYGFLLNVVHGQEYDDLVFVRTSYPNEVDPAVVREQNQPSNSKLVTRPPIHFSLHGVRNKLFAIESSFLKWNERTKLYYADLFVKSTNGAISVQEVKVDLIQSGVSLLSIPPVFDCDSIAVQSSCRVRLFISSPKRIKTTLKLAYKSKDHNFEIKWKN